MELDSGDDAQESVEEAESVLEGSSRQAYGEFMTDSSSENEGVEWLEEPTDSDESDEVTDEEFVGVDYLEDYAESHDEDEDSYPLGVVKSASCGLLLHKGGLSSFSSLQESGSPSASEPQGNVEWLDETLLDEVGAERRISRLSRFENQENMSKLVEPGSLDIVKRATGTEEAEGVVEWLDETLLEDEESAQIVEDGGPSCKLNEFDNPENISNLIELDPPNAYLNEKGRTQGKVDCLNVHVASIGGESKPCIVGGNTSPQVCAQEGHLDAPSCLTELSSTINLVEGCNAPSQTLMKVHESIKSTGDEKVSPGEKVCCRVKKPPKNYSKNIENTSNHELNSPCHLGAVVSDDEERPVIFSKSKEEPVLKGELSPLNDSGSAELKLLSVDKEKIESALMNGKSSPVVDVSPVFNLDSNKGALEYENYVNIEQKTEPLSPLLKKISSSGGIVKYKYVSVLVNGELTQVCVRERSVADDFAGYLKWESSSREARKETVAATSSLPEQLPELGSPFPSNRMEKLTIPAEREIDENGERSLDGKDSELDVSTAIDNSPGFVWDSNAVAVATENNTENLGFPCSDEANLVDKSIDRCVGVRSEPSNIGDSLAVDEFSDLDCEPYSRAGANDCNAQEVDMPIIPSDTQAMKGGTCHVDEENNSYAIGVSAVPIGIKDCPAVGDVPKLDCEPSSKVAGYENDVVKMSCPLEPGDSDDVEESKETYCKAEEISELQNRNSFKPKAVEGNPGDENNDLGCHLALRDIDEVKDVRRKIDDSRGCPNGTEDSSASAHFPSLDLDSNSRAEAKEKTVDMTCSSRNMAEVLDAECQREGTVGTIMTCLKEVDFCASKEVEMIKLSIDKKNGRSLEGKHSEPNASSDIESNSREAAIEKKSIVNITSHLKLSSNSIDNGNSVSCQVGGENDELPNGMHCELRVAESSSNLNNSVEFDLGSNSTTVEVGLRSGEFVGSEKSSEHPVENGNKTILENGLGSNSTAINNEVGLTSEELAGSEKRSEQPVESSETLTKCKSPVEARENVTECAKAREGLAEALHVGGSEDSSADNICGPPNIAKTILNAPEGGVSEEDREETSPLGLPEGKSRGAKKGKIPFKPSKIGKKGVCKINSGPKSTMSENKNASHSGSGHECKIMLKKMKCVTCQVRVCPECLCEFPGRLRHHLTRGPKNQECPKCGIVMDSDCAYKAHMRLHEGQLPAICPECGVVYSANASKYLFRHFWLKCLHIYKLSFYNCQSSRCSDLYQTRKSLQEHMLQRHTKTEYKCKVCNITVKAGKKKALEHVLIRHRANANTTLGIWMASLKLCSFCGEVTDELSEHVWTHARNAKSIKKFFCTCGDYFDREDGFSAHSDHCSVSEITATSFIETYKEQPDLIKKKEEDAAASSTQTFEFKRKHLRIDSPVRRAKPVPLSSFSSDVALANSFINTCQTCPRTYKTGVSGPRVRSPAVGEGVKSMGCEVSVLSDDSLERSFNITDLSYYGVPEDHRGYCATCATSAAVARELQKQCSQFGTPFFCVNRENADWIMRRTRLEENNLEKISEESPNPLRSAPASKGTKCPLCDEYFKCFAEFYNHTKTQHPLVILIVKPKSESVKEPQTTVVGKTVCENINRPKKLTLLGSMPVKNPAFKDVAGGKLVQNKENLPNVSVVSRGKIIEFIKRPTQSKSGSILLSSRNKSGAAPTCTLPKSGEKSDSGTKQTNEAKFWDESYARLQSAQRGQLGIDCIEIENSSSKRLVKKPKRLLELFEEFSDDGKEEEGEEMCEIPVVKNATSDRPTNKAKRLLEDHTERESDLNEGNQGVEADTTASGLNDSATRTRVVRKPKRLLEELEEVIELSPPKKIRLGEQSGLVKSRKSTDSNTDVRHKSPVCAEEIITSTSRRSSYSIAEIKTESVHSEAAESDSDKDDVSLLDRLIDEDTFYKKRKKSFSTQVKKIKYGEHVDFSSGQFLAEKRSGVDVKLFCANCNIRFVDGNIFRDHLKTHQVDKDTHQCMECGECFVVRPSLEMHLLALHKIKDIARYNEELNQKSNPNVTAKPVEEEQPLKENQCRICRKVFSSPTSHNQHFRSHGMAFLREAKKDGNISKT